MTATGSFSGTTLLLILDGWGHRPDAPDNAIATARTPVWDDCWGNMPHTLLGCSGDAVGLPDGQMGSSEVGHMNLGAGRIVYQDLTRISRAIERGDWVKNPAFVSMFEQLASSQKTLHLLGLLSPGGVHSHQDHIHAMLRQAAEAGVQKIMLHAFLDGRDTPPRSAKSSITQTEALCRALSNDSRQVALVSLCGRYFAMDRDGNWDRTALAYDLITQGKANNYATSAEAALAAAYAAGQSDEFVEPTVVSSENNPAAFIEDGDSVVFMNFRSDRARQLSQALTDPEFGGFTRSQVRKTGSFVTLTHYADDLEATVAFPQETLHNTLGEYMADLSKNQLRIAETEKYAHVTFFFSGGREQPWPQEDRILVPSPNVPTYDQKPEMSAHEVTDELEKAIHRRHYDLIVCNFANSDMVGHTGIFDATVKAVETLDSCMGRVLRALRDTGGQCLITADHGNAEQMFDSAREQAHTAHTCSDVPLVYMGPRHPEFASDGRLADVAPTLLTLMELPVPSEMTGRSLVL